MAKFYGAIGFAESEEIKPGIFKDRIVEHFYAGDFQSSKQQFESSDQHLDDVNFADDLSIVSDAYAFEHIAYLKYVVIDGTKWKIRAAEKKYPRLILTIGGVFNENRR